MVTKPIPIKPQPKKRLTVTPDATDMAFQQVAVGGLGVFGTGFDQHEQINVSRVTLRQLDNMIEIDGQAAALFSILTLPFRANVNNYDIIPQEGGKREAAFIEDQLRKAPEDGGMKIAFDDVSANICMAFLHGFKVFEQVFHVNQKEQITLDYLLPVAPYDVWVRVDDFGFFDGFVQRTSYQGRYINARVEKPYSAIFTIGHEKNPHYGKSLFLPAFYHFDKKHKLYYIAHIAHQLNATPVRVGNTPPGTIEEKKEAFLKAIESIGFNTAIVMPDGYTLDQFPKNIRTISPYMEIINHHDVMMSKAIVAHFMELGLAGQSGSWALSKNNFDLFMDTYEIYNQMYANFWNRQIFPKMVDWNYNTKKYPKIRVRASNDRQRELLRDIFYKVAVDEAPNVSAEFLYQMEKEISAELGFGSLTYEDKTQPVSFAKDVYPRQPIQSAPMAGGVKGIDGAQGSSRNRPTKRSIASSSEQPKNQNPS